MRRGERARDRAKEREKERGRGGGRVYGRGTATNGMHIDLHKPTYIRMHLHAHAHSYRHIHTYAHNLHIRMYTHTPTHTLGIRTHPYSHIDLRYTHTHIQTYTRTYTYTSKCTHTHAYAHASTYPHIHKYTCTHTHIHRHPHPYPYIHTQLDPYARTYRTYTHTHPYIHTHIHTHTHTHRLSSAGSKLRWKELRLHPTRGLLPPRRFVSCSVGVLGVLYTYLCVSASPAACAQGNSFWVAKLTNVFYGGSLGVGIVRQAMVIRKAIETQPDSLYIARSLISLTFTCYAGILVFFVTCTLVLLEALPLTAIWITVFGICSSLWVILVALPFRMSFWREFRVARVAGNRVAGYSDVAGTEREKKLEMLQDYVEGAGKKLIYEHLSKVCLGVCVCMCVLCV